MSSPGNSGGSGISLVLCWKSFARRARRGSVNPGFPWCCAPPTPPARCCSGGARRAEERSAAGWTGARRGAERRWERGALGDGPQGGLTGWLRRLPEPLPGRGPVSSAWRGPPAAEGRAARRLSDCCSGRCCAEVSGKRSTS